MNEIISWLTSSSNTPNWFVLILVINTLLNVFSKVLKEIGE